MTAAGRPSSSSVDIVVVGGGMVGLSVALAAADRGMAVSLVAVERPGAASRAGAGLLVPHYSGDAVRDSVIRFMVAARDLYPSYVAMLEERSGVAIPLSRGGAVEVARSSEECAALAAAAPPDATLLTASDIVALEPTLAPMAGGLLFPHDGAVDNVRLTDALSFLVSRHERVRTIAATASEIALDRGDAAVTTDGGTRVAAARVVLAAGAWSGSIHGLRRHVPVRPLRGQICTLRGAPLRHVVLGPDAYMVSRDGDRTLVGSTMEDVGFDPGTTTDAVAALCRFARTMCPAFDGAPVVAAWSGLRPATPDLLPILGPDPDYPALLYACGHSRNGILLAPLTGAIISSIAAGEDVRWDLSPFRIDRFAPGGSSNRRDFN